MVESGRRARPRCGTSDFWPVSYLRYWRDGPDFGRTLRALHSAASAGRPLFPLVPTQLPSPQRGRPWRRRSWVPARSVNSSDLFSAPPLAYDITGQLSSPWPTSAVPWTTLPALSTGTQSVDEGQEIASSPCESTRRTVQDMAPCAGPVVVSTLPALSTATQRFGDGHEMPSRLYEPSTSRLFQRLSGQPNARYRAAGFRGPSHAEPPRADGDGLAPPLRLRRQN